MCNTAYIILPDRSSSDPTDKRIHHINVFGKYGSGQTIVVIIGSLNHFI